MSVGPVEGEVFAEDLHPGLGEKAFRGVEVGVVGLADRADGEAESVGDAGEMGECLVEQIFAGIAVGAALANEVVLGRDLEQVDLVAMGEGLAMDAEAVGESDAVGIAGGRRERSWRARAKGVGGRTWQGRFVGEGRAETGDPPLHRPGAGGAAER
jgi:hypothetical protein